MRIPSRFADVESLRVVVPTHVDELDAPLDQPPCQQRRRTEECAAVSIAGRSTFGTEVKSLADSRRRQHVECQALLAGKAAEVGVRFQLAELIIKLLDQPAAVFEPIEGHSADEIHVGEPRLAAHDLWSPMSSGG